MIPAPTPRPAMRVLCPDRVAYESVTMRRDDRPGHESAWTGLGVLTTGRRVAYGVEVDTRKLRRPAFGRRHGKTWTVFVRGYQGFERVERFHRPIGQSEACALISHMLRQDEGKI